MSLIHIKSYTTVIEHAGKDQRISYPHCTIVFLVNSAPLTASDMNAMGLKITGATGQAKLKVLHYLDLKCIL